MKLKQEILKTLENNTELSATARNKISVKISKMIKDSELGLNNYSKSEITLQLYKMVLEAEKAESDSPIMTAMKKKYTKNRK